MVIAVKIAAEHGDGGNSRAVQIEVAAQPIVSIGQLIDLVKISRLLDQIIAIGILSEIHTGRGAVGVNDQKRVANWTLFAVRGDIFHLQGVGVGVFHHSRGGAAAVQIQRLYGTQILHILCKLLKSQSGGNIGAAIGHHQQDGAVLFDAHGRARMAGILHILDLPILHQPRAAAHSLIQTVRYSVEYLLVPDDGLTVTFDPKEIGAVSVVSFIVG